MTTAELIGLLQQEDPDGTAEVCVVREIKQRLKGSKEGAKDGD